jgi:hypothetical protein
MRSRFVLLVFGVILLPGYVALLGDGSLFGCRQLDREEERINKGAGIVSAWQCTASSGYNCVNGLVIGGTCSGSGDGVQCNAARAPKQCLSVYGVFNNCTATINAFCPTGVILRCKNGKWVNKAAGNAACGRWDDC